MKKIFTFLLFSVIAAIGAHAQDVNIPDSIFKSILVGNPDINTNQDQEIQVSEAHAYQYTIDVSNSGIYDLTGIEEFTSMFQLKCGGNHLDSLNVSGLTALSSLECSSNQLVSLNLSGLTGLQKLSCFNNQLASLNASGLTSLSSLECTNNQLVSLNVSGNTALSFLFCANNQLASLNLTGLTALKYLYCPANELTSLSVLDNTALTTLSCYRNRLASLDVSGLTNLRTLNCVLNQLASLNLKNGHNGSIWSMDCTSNSPLTCIQVDNVSNANANTNWQKDAGAKYRTDCGPCSPSGSDTSATACKSFTWHGVTYYTTGDKTFTIPNVIGCDSVVTLHLTIRASSTVSVTDAGCFGSATGSITVTPNGSAPFSYRIGTGNFVQGDSSYKFDNLKAGTYKTYVQDSTGCIGVAAGIIISQNAKVTAMGSSTPVSCSSPASGTITIDNPVGTAPFQYKIGSAGTLTPLTAPTTITGRKAGKYGIFVVDSNGCSSSSIVVTVAQPALPPVSYSVVQPTCSTPTGSITLSCPGTDGITYKINPGSSIYKIQTVYPNLSAGTYYGYAKDVAGCVGRTVAIVLSPATGCTPRMARGTQQATTEEGSTTLSVSILPNPSSNVFKLTAHTAKAEAIQLRVIDVNGKVVYTAKGLPTQAITFGEALTVGIYMIEVRQGNEIKTLKVVKTL